MTNFQTWWLEVARCMDALFSKIISLRAHNSMPVHSVFSSVETDASPSKLAGSIAAQPANKVCRKAARQLDQTETEFSSNSEQVLFRRASTDAALQSPMLQVLQQHPLTFSHGAPLFCATVHLGTFTTNESAILNTVPLIRATWALCKNPRTSTCQLLTFEEITWKGNGSKGHNLYTAHVLYAVDRPASQEGSEIKLLLLSLRV